MLNKMADSDSGDSGETLFDISVNAGQISIGFEAGAPDL